MANSLNKDQRLASVATALRQNPAGGVESNHDISGLDCSVRDTSLESFVSAVEHRLILVTFAHSDDGCGFQKGLKGNQPRGKFFNSTVRHTPLPADRREIKYPLEGAARGDSKASVQFGKRIQAMQFDSQVM